MTFESDLEASRQASATRRWIENSGPTYEELLVRLVQIIGDVACVWLSDGSLADVHRDRMSYASWAICLCTRPGSLVLLKIRCDNVGLWRERA